MNSKSNKVSQLFTVAGTGGTSLTPMTLSATIIKSAGNSTTAPTFIRIPHGMKMKIWEKTVYNSVSAGTVSVAYAHSSVSTIASSAAGYTIIDIQNGGTGGADTGLINHRKGRPIVLNGFTGKESVLFIPSCSTMSISYEVEITNE